MDELSAEPVEGTEESAQAEGPAQNGEATPMVSEIREHFYSLFAGISTIWPQSVCGH